MSSELRERKKALKARLRELRENAQARLGAKPEVQRERRRKRLVRTAIVIAILLLLLLIRCDCDHPQPHVAVPAASPAAKLPPKKPSPPHAKIAGLKGKVDRQNRGGLRDGNSEVPPWLEDFRLQVTSRSPELAKCFAGVDRPGALRWTTLVNPVNGSVSGHQLEGVGADAGLSEAQRSCVLHALISPRYRLEGTGLPPSEVSLVLEF